MEKNQKNNNVCIFLFLGIILFILPWLLFFPEVEKILGMDLALVILFIIIYAPFIKKKEKEEISKKSDKKIKELYINQSKDWSYIIPFYERLIILLSKYTLFQFFIWISKRMKKWEKAFPPMWFIDQYVFLMTFIFVIIYFLVGFLGDLNIWIKGFLSLFLFGALYELLLYKANIIFIHRKDRFQIKDQDESYHYILTRDAGRWIILTFTNIFQILINFSTLYLLWGNQFSDPISDYMTAFYQSTIVLSTLGFGQNYPICSLAKLIIIGQILYFLFFFLLVLPRVISSIRVNEVIDVMRKEEEKQKK